MIGFISSFSSFLQVDQNSVPNIAPVLLRSSNRDLGDFLEDYGPYLLISILIFAVLWGFVAMSIVRNKGYDNEDDKNKWFLVGFVLGLIGVIIAACQPSLVNMGNNAGNNNVIVQSNNSTADEIKKFKELLDAGVITEQEFQAKKDQLLKQ